ncbi:MAG: 5-formyltetrahydrofolate cyclo-ligase [Streptococcaceae bacterium]|jgi:5-formyltetrahydrofolate cyclo-ligase|nr:5-formyltetrahydrofolate cyclo-ligase [Streptococcaceae bacterium]
MKNKAITREEILMKLRNFSVLTKKQQTSEILSAFIRSKKFQRARSIGLYMNTAIEFELKELFVVSEAAGKKIFVPRTLPDYHMSFVQLEMPYNSQQLARTEFGILEPKWGEIGIPDLIVVPGLAWNKTGHRIGFGAGYYDRYLASFKGDTVSLAYDFQRVDFEPEIHDVAIKEIFSV